jgi:predicted transglutaminase-like cysteine proteinase
VGFVLACRALLALCCALSMAALSACASSGLAESQVPALDGSRLQAGAWSPPPEGLLGYCLRAPQECGDTSALGLVGAQMPTGASAAPANLRQRFETRADADRAVQSLFDQLLQAQLSALATHAGDERAEPVLSPQRWAELRQINRSVNHAITPMTDRDLYGVEEFWTRPVMQKGGREYGDCEDYALEKRAQLIAAGWSPDALALAIAVAPRIGLHATLIVQTDQGDLVLDNMHDEPQQLSRLNYAWVARQARGSLVNWASAWSQTPQQQTILVADSNAERTFHALLAERLQTARSVDAPEEQERPANQIVVAMLAQPDVPATAEAVEDWPRPSAVKTRTVPPTAAEKRAARVQLAALAREQANRAALQKQAAIHCIGRVGIVAGPADLAVLERPALGWLGPPTKSPSDSANRAAIAGT